MSSDGRSLLLSKFSLPVVCIPFIYLFICSFISMFFFTTTCHLFFAGNAAASCLGAANLLDVKKK